LYVFFIFHGKDGKDGKAPTIEVTDTLCPTVST